MSAPFAARLGFRAAHRAAPSLRNNATRFTQRRAYQAPAENPANVEASPAAKGEPTSAFGRLWNSPVGPKTVHFWAPIMKVSLSFGTVFSRRRMCWVWVRGLGGNYLYK